MGKYGFSVRMNNSQINENANSRTGIKRVVFKTRRECIEWEWIWIIINNLVTWLVISEAFLLLSFIIIFLSTRNPEKSVLKSVLLVILFIIGGAPALYLTIDHLNSNYVDANIGLGLAFMFTWIYSIIAFFIAIILLVIKKRK